MMAVALLFYSVSAFAISYIVGHSTLSKLWRERIWGDDPETARNVVAVAIVLLLECPACFGFWTGVVAALVGTTPFVVEHLDVVAWGLFTSGSNLILAKVTKLV